MHLYYVLCAAASWHVADQLAAVRAAPQGNDANGDQYSSYTAPATMDVSLPGQERHQPNERTPLKQNPFSPAQPFLIPDGATQQAVDLGLYGGQVLEALPSNLSSDASSSMDEDTDDFSTEILRTCVSYEDAYVALDRRTSIASLSPNAISPQLNKQLNRYFSNIIVQVNQFKHAPGINYKFPSYAYGPPLQSIDITELKAALARNDYIFFLHWDDDDDMFLVSSAHETIKSSHIDCYDLIGTLEVSTYFVHMFTLPFEYELESMHDLVFRTLAQNMSYLTTDMLLQSKWADYIEAAKEVYDKETGIP